MSTEASGATVIGESGFAARHFAVLAVAVLCLAAFNLTFRLTRENVAEWDESLYAVSALEMVRSDQWVGTTFFGQLDYSNSKPPLNVWLLALSFKTFGVSLLSLRVAAAASAWLTVLTLLLWARQTVGACAAVFSALVLSTAFGFLHVHAGRSGNPDALLTLLLLLIVIVEWAAHRRPAVLAWLGPFLAGVFLLKGMAVAMPLLFIVAVEAWRVRSRAANPGRVVPWRQFALAAVLFAIPVTSWAIARWRVDNFDFLRLLFTQDLVALSTRVLDGHAGSAFYYLDVLQRHQYEWLAVAALAAWLRWSDVRMALRRWVWDGDETSRAFSRPCIAWTLVAIGVPSLMQTKLQWYLNPFYPFFALGTGWLLATGLCRAGSDARRWTLTAFVCVALIVAEGKLLWHSVYQRALEGSAQELVMQATADLGGRTVYRDGWTRAEAFVVRGIAGAEFGVAQSPDQFLSTSGAGDYYLAVATLSDARLVRVQSNGAFTLFQRRNGSRVGSAVSLARPPVS